MPSQHEFTELLQPNLLPLNRFVFGMVGNQFDAEDIVQETVVKAFIHFADFRAESKFKTWLMSIAINEVRTRRRTEFRSRTTYFDFDQLERLASATSNDSPFRQYQENETTRLVQNAMVTLHPTYKEMIRLRAIDGLNIADTARRLSISVPAAKARYYRAVHRLSHTLVRKTRRPLRRADKTQ
jgi:RNA polymerase sigma-70 factor (ECF subfamily)